MKISHKILLWAPPSFCIIICIPVIIDIMLPNINLWSQPSFFSFLPICFLIVSFQLYILHRKINKIKEYLKNRKQKEE